METQRLKSWQRKPIWLYILTALILFFLILPVLIVIPMSFTDSTLLKFPPQGFSLRWYEKFFHDTKWLNGAIVSLKAALGTMVLAVTLGTMGAICVSKKVMRKSKWVKITMQLPMMLPSVIVAVSMYLRFGKYQVIGKLWTIIAAHTCLAIPMVMTTMSAALVGLDPAPYDAARVLGANHLQATTKVVLPQIKPSIFSSCLFAFITSFDESVLALFITKTKTQTLPKLMFAELKYGVSPELAAVSTLLICVTITFFALSKVVNAMSPNVKAARLYAKAEKEKIEQEEKNRLKAEKSANLV